jgi:CRISPR-associated protein Cas2
MPRAEMLMVFSYDIADDRRRRRIAEVLENQLVRVQESVFEGRLSAAASDRLAAAVEREMGAGDSLRVYAIAADGMARCKQIGGAPLAVDADYWLL